MKSVGNRPLRVFLCHSSNDKPAVRELYQKLHAEPWIQPWLDEEELYPGQDWNMEIEKAVEAADAIIVCLSKNSITKEGYVQKEIKTALDYSDYKPEGTVFIIPVRLEDCKPHKRLSKWQYADYFEGQRGRAFERLLVSLKRRADSLDLKVNISTPENKKEISTVVKSFLKDPSTDFETFYNAIFSDEKLLRDKITFSNDMEFMRVPAGKFLMGSDNHEDDEKPQRTVDITYDYWMGRYPITNELYNAYVEAKGAKHPVDGWEKKKDHPVTCVKWTDAMEYCQWLNNLLKGELPSGLVLHLPTEVEWEKAACGIDGREYPWGNEFDINKCNNSYRSTTPIGLYSPQGDSPYGCGDMSGNVLEWTHTFLKKTYPYINSYNHQDRRVLRGGSFRYPSYHARCSSRNDFYISDFYDCFGFRITVSSNLS